MLYALFPSFVRKKEQFLCVFKYSILIGYENWSILLYFLAYIYLDINI